MRTVRALALLAAIAATSALADNSGPTQRSAPPPPVEAPTRGMHQDSVLRRWGEPQARMAAVGGDLPQHPPITRWVYPAFTVYFERELVIASVANRAPATPPPT